MKKILLTILSLSLLQTLKAQNVNYPNNAGNGNSGDKNTSIGWEAGQSLTAQSIQNTFVGHMAGEANTGSYNSFYGSFSGILNASGGFNSFYGARAGYSNTVGVGNTYFGALSGENATGGNNVFVGVQSGQKTTGNLNTFLGTLAGLKNISGGANVFVGYAAGSNSEFGGLSVLVGYAAGGQATNVSQSVFVGYEAGNINKGAMNSFVGFKAGNKNETGEGNTFFGHESGNKNVSGRRNTLVGNFSGSNLVDGSFNVIMGSYAGAGSNGGSNVLIGDYSGHSNNGSANVIIGHSAGTTSDGRWSTYVGAYSGLKSKGDWNTYLGNKAGYTSETGSKNVFIGHTAGYYEQNSNKLHIATSSRNSLIYGDFSKNHVAIGTITTPAQQAAYTLYVSGDVYTTGTYLPSDKRFKKNIKAIKSPLEMVGKIEGKTYEYKQEFTQTEGEKTSRFPEGTQLGFIAQDLKKIMPEAVREDEDGMLAVNYTAVIPVLVEAIKALSSEIEDLKAQVNTKNDDTELNDETEVNKESQGFGLEQNYPNPSYGSTTIVYQIPSEFAGNARVIVFDLQGKKVTEIDHLQPGKNKIIVDKNETGVGLFHYSLVVDNQIIETRKMLIE